MNNLSINTKKDFFLYNESEIDRSNNFKSLTLDIGGSYINEQMSSLSSYEFEESKRLLSRMVGNGAQLFELCGISIDLYEYYSDNEANSVLKRSDYFTASQKFGSLNSDPNDPIGDYPYVRWHHGVYNPLHLKGISAEDIRSLSLYFCVSYAYEQGNFKYKFFKLTVSREGGFFSLKSNSIKEIEFREIAELDVNFRKSALEKCSSMISFAKYNSSPDKVTVNLNVYAEIFMPVIFNCFLDCCETVDRSELPDWLSKLTYKYINSKELDIHWSRSM